MGESYRGLTIRIGADTTALSKALKGVTGDAKSAQTALRAIEKALKVDPSNMTALNLKLQQVNKNAVAAASRLDLMRIAQQQMKDTGIESVAKSLKEMGITAGTARANYVRLDEELSTVKERFRALRNECAEAGLTAASTGEKFEKLSQKRFNNLSMDDVIADLKEAGKDVSALEEKYRALAAQHAAYQKQLQQANDVERYESNAAAIEREKAEVQKLAAEYMELKAAMAGTDSGEYKKAAAELRTTSKAAATLKQRFEQLDKAFKLDPSNIGVAKMRMDTLKESEAACNEEIEQLKAQLASLNAQGAEKTIRETENLALKFEKAKAEASSLNAEVKQLEGALATANSELNTAKIAGSGYAQAEEKVESLTRELKTLRTSADAAAEEMSRLAIADKQVATSASLASKSAELNSLKTAATGATASLGRMYSSATNIGLSLSTTLTPAISMFARYAVTAAEEVDAAYRNMRKTVQGTEEDYEALYESALAYSQTHYTSASDLLEIEAMGGQLGIAANALDTFAETISNINIATNIDDAEEAATQLGQLANITGMTTDEFTSFSDSLTRLGNNNAALESDIMDISQRIASESTIIGMSTSDILAWSTSLSATGQKSEAAATAFSKTEAMMESAVANGGEKLEGFASVAGMTAEQFSTAWETNPTDAIYAFIEGLNQIEASGGSADATLSDLGITGVRQKQALEGLMQTIYGLTDNITMSSDAWDGVSDEWGDAGDAAREAERKCEGFSGQIQLLRNNAEVFANSFGESIAPVLAEVNSKFSDFVDWFDGLSDGMKQGVSVVAIFSAALGPLLTLYGALGPAMERVKTTNAAMTSGMQGASGTISAAASSLKKYAVAAKEASSAQTTLKGKTAAAAGSLKTMAASSSIASVAMSKLATATKGVALFAAISAVAQLAGYFEEASEKAEQFETATEGIEGAARKTASASSSYKASIDNIDSGLDDATTSAEEYTEAIAGIASEMQDNIKEYRTEASTLDSARAAIEAYADSSEELTAVEQGQLKNALDIVNDALGTQYTVVDSTNGTISNAKGKYDEAASAAGKYKDKILELIDAKKQEMQEELNTENYKKALEAQADAEQAYIDAYNAMKDYRDGIADLDAEYASGAISEDSYKAKKDALSAAYSDERDALNAAKAEMESTSEAADTLAKNQAYAETAAENMGAAMQEIANDTGMQAAMSASNQTFEDLKASMGEAGVSAKQLKSISEETGASWTVLGTSYDGTAASVIEGALRMMGVNDQLSTSIASSGVSWGTLSAIGTENMNNLVAACGNDSTAIIQQLQSIDGTDLSGKTLVITEDGIEAVSNKIDGLNAKSLGIKKLTIGDDGTIESVNGKVDGLDSNLQELVDEPHYVVINSKGKQRVVSNLSEIKENERLVENADISISDNGTISSMDAKFNKSVKNIESKTSKKYTAKIEADTESANTDVNSFFSNLSSWVSKKWNALVSVETESAKGHVFTSGSGIPRFATGGIVTSATLTEYGLVGESGAEAMIPSANGSMGIFPLSNRRYVRPFAQAVAREMGGVGGTTVINMQNNVSGTGDPQAYASRISRQLSRKLKMGV